MIERESPGCRRMLLGTLAVIGAMILCIGTVIFGIDRACVADLTSRLPIYPNATVTTQRHNYMTMFGMGESMMILHSDDASDVVSSWYSKTVGAVEYNKLQQGALREMGRATWAVDDAPSGKGSQITLYGYCGS